MDHETGRQRVTKRSSRHAPRPLLTLVGTAILLAAPARPLVRADDGKSAPAAANPKETSAPAIPTFDLRIVGPDGKPISDAKVNLSTQPPIDKVRIRAGKFLNKPRFGINILSDADGRVVIERPAHLQYLNFRIHKPGYGYYWSWSNKPETLPASQTVTLESAWTIGGLVVDGDGKPVPNARVLLTIRWAGSGQMALVDRLWTNSKGIWRFESAPQSMSAVNAEISEPKFMTVHPTLSRQEFEIKPGQEPTGKTTLSTGLAVTGKVTDETGKPIAKALVRTGGGNDIRTAFTDKKGVYRLEGCGPGSARIVASAKGRAPDLQEVEIGPDLGPIDFRLKPGNTIRVRVLDEAGKPVPKAQVYFQQWRGQYQSFVFDRAPRETDVDGVWEWNEAPQEELMASIGRPGGMTLSNRPLSPRKEEFVFRVPSALVISGKVVDAETHQPIKGFRLMSGYVWMGQQVVWEQNNNAAPSGSTYEIKKTYENGANLVRVEADGYMPAVSREIKSDEAKVTIDFELLKGKTVSLTVLTPDGAAAARAQVAIPGPGEQVMVSGGELQEQGGNGNLGGLVVGLVRQLRPARRGLAAVRETDKEGKFRAEAKNTNCWIVVTHPSGYAELPGMPNSNPRIIKLQPWARIEGTFQVARKLQAHAQMSLFRSQFFFGQNSPQIMVHALQTTDAHGRFVFDRIAPGQHQISSMRMNGSAEGEMTSSMTVSANCAPGKTVHVDVGANGRPVIGQLRKPPDVNSDLKLSSAQIWVSQEGNQMSDDSRLQFNATPDREGNFAIDDIPPGNYSLGAYFPNVQNFQIQQHRFVVPKVNDKLWQRPVDLGVLTISTPERARAARVRAAR
jgi:protocatechuate 3,4-dioxygenase beta subunit